MKKDRNCGCGNTPYPTYPGMYNQGIMVPNMPIPMPPNYGYLNNNMMMPTNNMMQGVSSNTLEQQIIQLQQQVNNLERRVTILENSNQNNTTSFGSNYQML